MSGSPTVEKSSSQNCRSSRRETAAPPVAAADVRLSAPRRSPSGAVVGHRVHLSGCRSVGCGTGVRQVVARGNDVRTVKRTVPGPHGVPRGGRHVQLIREHLRAFRGTGAVFHDAVVCWKSRQWWALPDPITGPIRGLGQPLLSNQRCQSGLPQKPRANAVSRQRWRSSPVC